jgi:hypothetical protein
VRSESVRVSRGTNLDEHDCGLDEALGDGDHEGSAAVDVVTTVEVCVGLGKELYDCKLARPRCGGEGRNTVGVRLLEACLEGYQKLARL